MPGATTGQPSGVDSTGAQGNNNAYLKRVDPEIEEVLATSGHVCLYAMTVESQTWTKKNVEGSLFLLKRKSAPRFQLLVLNKQSTDNYTEEVHAGLDFECNPPYLMYTHGNSEILGVWFYEQSDLEKVESVLKRIKNGLPQQSNAAAAPAAAPAAQASSSTATGGVSDSDFWDKPADKAAVAAAAARHQANAAAAVAAANNTPVPVSAKALAAAQAQASLAQHQAQSQAAAATAAPPSNNLSNLFKNAAAKQQATAAPQAGGAPVLLPPSFFSQGAAPAAASAVPNKHLEQLRKGAALSPAPSSEVQKAPEEAAGNPLAKLFAKAAVQPGAAPAAPPAAVQAAPSGASSVEADREKVRALLNRMATNQSLLDLLAVEMRAVGLL